MPIISELADAFYIDVQSYCHGMEAARKSNELMKAQINAQIDRLIEQRKQLQMAGDLYVAKKWGEKEREMLYGDGIKPVEQVFIDRSSRVTLIRLRHIVSGMFNRDKNTLRIQQLRQDLEIGDAVVIDDEYFTVEQWMEVVDQAGVLEIQLRPTLERGDACE